MAYNIAANQVLATPVSSFEKGQALRLADRQAAQDYALNEQKRQANEIKLAQAKKPQLPDPKRVASLLGFAKDSQVKALSLYQQTLATTGDETAARAAAQKQSDSDLKFATQVYGPELGNQISPDHVWTPEDAKASIAQVDDVLGKTNLKPATVFRDATGKAVSTAVPGTKRYQALQEKGLFPGQPVGTPKEESNAEAAASKKETLLTHPVADGKVQDYAVDLNNPSDMKPVGEPYDPNANKQSTMGSRAQTMLQRVLSSANSAIASLVNIAELPQGASSGIFGVGASPGHGILSSVKGVLTNKASSQEVQDYNVQLAGVSRALSTLETQGLAPNGSITASMDSIQLRKGDTGYTKLRKLAEMRQIIITNLEPVLTNPRLTNEQKDQIHGYIDKVQHAIPYTNHDITVLEQKQDKDPSFTFQDLIKERNLRPAGVTQPAAEDAAQPASEAASTPSLPAGWKVTVK